MNEPEATSRGSRGRHALMVVLLLVVAANLLLTLKLHHEATKLGRAVPKRPDLPCAAIPTRFLMEEPVCAQKLIEAMNVTNVQVVTDRSRFGVSNRSPAPLPVAPD